MFLLDTNVVSELRNIRVDRADPNVAHWADSVDAVDLYVSAITVFELTIGVLRAERLDAVQGAAVRAWGGRAGATRVRRAHFERWRGSC